MIEWKSRKYERPVGRPQTRWTDGLKHPAETEWINLATDKKAWKNMGEAYIRGLMKS